MNGSARADFLHVIRAAPNHDTGGKETLQGLEPTKTLFAEMRAQGWSIEIQPDGLNIHYDAETCCRGDRLGAEKIRVSDAWARRAQAGQFLIQLVIDIEQGVHCSVTDAVCGELKTGFRRGADHRKQAILLNKQNASILWIGDRIDVAHSPRLAGRGTAGKQAPARVVSHAVESQPIVT